MKLLLQTILLLLLSLASLTAQESLIEVSVSVDRSRITIGDLITYRIAVDRDAQLQIHDPGKGTNLGSFEIRDYKVLPPEQKDGRVLEQYEYFISVFDTGKFVIPAFPIAFRAAGTAKYQFIYAEPLEIYVESILKKGDVDIRDIRPPFGMPDRFWGYILIAGLLLLAGALAYWFWWRRRNANGEPVFRKTVIRPAHEIALEALEKLATGDLLERGQFKAFFTELSDIVRQYIENRYYIPAMEETSEELLESLKAVNLNEENTTFIKGILHNCDLVKFAKYVPNQKEIDTTMYITREFIEKTHLAFEAVEESEPVANE